MEAKGTLLILTVSLAMSLETSRGAMPFGRLTPLHYAPDDIRTVVVPRTENIPLFSSLLPDALPDRRRSMALSLKELAAGMLKDAIIVCNR
jgi:hypothetical protein